MTTQTIGELEIRDNGHDIYIRVPLPQGGRWRAKWLPTGARTFAQAAEIAKEAGVERLLLMARAGVLNRQAIAAITGEASRTCAAVLAEWQVDAAAAIAASTISAYSAQIEMLLSVGNRARLPVSSMRRDVLSNFVNDGTSSLATRKAKMAAIRALWGFAASRGYVWPDPTTALRIHRRLMTVEQLEPRPAFPFTEPEFRAILAHPRCVGFWSTAVQLSYWTALRFVDCVSLEWASLKPDAVLIWTKKRGKRVWLPLENQEMRDLVRGLLEQPREDPTYVFPVERRDYYGGRQWSFPSKFARIVDNLGILGKTFHSLRHSAISRWAAAGRSLEDIAGLVGHSSTETTAGYVHTG